MKFSIIIFNKLYIIAVFLVLTSYCRAQTNGLSPYSRFGIGVIHPQGSSTHAAMGGLTTPAWDGFAVNFSNPATYSALYRTTFQMGGKGTFLTVSDSSSSQKLSGARLEEMGFVFKRQGSRWAFGLGLVPYSTVNYSLTTKNPIDSVGDVLYTYDGDGGLNKAVAGVSKAFRLNAPGKGSAAHRLSVGFNLNYFFGALHQTRKIIFPDVNYLNTRINSYTSIYDFNADVGVHYLLPLKEVKQEDKIIESENLMIGASYSFGSKLNARFSELTESFYYFSEVEFPVDTAISVNNQGGSVNLPERISVGVSYLHTNKQQGHFMLGVDLKTQDWTKFTTQFGEDISTENLNRASTISVGMEYLPKPLDKSGNFLQKNTYRLGFRSTSTYLMLRSQEITQTAVTAGLSIPMVASRSFSKINLAVEVGQGGTTEHQLVKENFVNIFVGVSLSPHILNNWFVYRRYE